MLQKMIFRPYSCLGSKDVSPPIFLSRSCARDLIRIDIDRERGSLLQRTRSSRTLRLLIWFLPTVTCTTAPIAPHSSMFWVFFRVQCSDFTEKRVFFLLDIICDRNMNGFVVLCAENCLRNGQEWVVLNLWAEHHAQEQERVCCVHRRKRSSCQDLLVPFWEIRVGQGRKHEVRILRTVHTVSKDECVWGSGESTW